MAPTPGWSRICVKQALLNLARTPDTTTPCRTDKEAWARLAMQLGVKVIQIAERDRQVGTRRKQWGEFVNTWSSGAFVGESLQPAELGWGTHEKHWPHQGMEFGFGCGSSIYLNRARLHHARTFLGADGRTVSGLAHLARRGAFDPGLLHGARERQERLSADLLLRVSSLR